jgi:hypothetical protein
MISNNMITLSSGNVEVVVDAEHGSRLASLRFGETEILVQRAVTQWLRGLAARATEYLSTKARVCSCLSILRHMRFMVLCMTRYGKWSVLRQQVQLCESNLISGGHLQGGLNTTSVSTQHL